MLTSAFICELFEVIAYFAIIVNSRISYQDATNYGGIFNKVYRIKGNTIRIDQATLSEIGMVLGSIGIMCSLLLLTGLVKVYRRKALLRLFFAIYYLKLFFLCHSEAENLCYHGHVG